MSLSVSLSVCLLGTRVSCAETAETIEMQWGEACGGGDLCEPKEPCIGWGQDRMNPFATMTRC